MQNPQDLPTPLVSFVITYYNEPIEMLKECLKSIFSLSLTENECEVILVDDGSDLTPLNEIVEYRDKIIYLRQRNQGLSSARNAGIELCRGQFIQFVDADDYLIKAGYEHCLDIVRYHQPDIVMFTFTHVEAGIATPSLFDGPVSGAEYMRHNNLRACAWGYLFRKSLLLDLRFTPNLLHEDEEFTPQLVLRADSVYSTETCAYYYRERPQSIVHNSSARWTLKRLDDTEYVITQLDHLSATLPVAERQALQRRVAQLTMDYIYNIIVLTRSEHQLEERLKRLEKKGLFPLPYREYTNKYRLFRRLTTSKIGRKILLRTLPLTKKD